MIRNTSPSLPAFLKLITLLMITLLAGCASLSGNKDAPLQRTQWQLTEVQGYKITTKEGEQAAYIKLSPAGKVSGHSGCNQIFGQYHLQDSLISFSRMASTRKACMGRADETERYMLDMLKSPLMWVVKGERLVFFDNQQVVVARFKSVY
ncbi:META domain-containing protein [Litoribrevibacter euphylliae]|uniref:META domain-containing protein n=1 Tax=Litoribrevibacter euphylliae TaxID=1834034 RepID=A0ABV7HLG4_9GAMM